MNAGKIVNIMKNTSCPIFCPLVRLTAVMTNPTKDIAVKTMDAPPPIIIKTTNKYATIFKPFALPSGLFNIPANSMVKKVKSNTFRIISIIFSAFIFGQGFFSFTCFAFS